MYCNNCGNEIGNNEKLCPICGVSCEASLHQEMKESFNQTIPPVNEPYPSADQVAPPKKQRNKRSKVKMVLLLAVVILIAAVIGSTVFCFTSPAYQISQSISEGDYSDALNMYKSSVEDSSIQKWLANQLLSDTVPNIMNEYEDGSISYEQALTGLEKVSRMSELEIAEAAAAQWESLQVLYASEQAYDLAESYYEAGDYVTAMEVYLEVDESDSEHYEDAQSKIESARENYRALIIEQVGSPSTTDEYETAISLLNTALVALPDDEELTALLENCEEKLQETIKSSTLSEATNAIEAGNYEEAFDLLETALNTFPEDSDLTALLVSSQSQYEEYITSQVEELTEQEDYENALELLTQALKVLPDSTVLKEQQTTIEETRPIKLSELKISDSYNYNQVDDLTISVDTIGNLYNPGNLFTIWTPTSYKTGYVDYYLNEQYTSLTGTIAVGDDSSSSSCTVTLYGNGDSILYTGTFSRSMEPVAIDVNVEGVDWFRIEVVGADISWRTMVILFSNFVLCR